MSDQSYFSLPSFSLSSKHSVRVLFKKLKMESDRKYMIYKEMVIDILMLVLLTVAPILLALI